MDLTSISQAVNGIQGESSTPSKPTQGAQRLEKESPLATKDAPAVGRDAIVSPTGEDKRRRSRGGRRSGAGPNSASQDTHTSQEKSDGSQTEGNVSGEVGDATATRKVLTQQLEYYFSDENLVRDRFLEKEFEKDESGQGYVSLNVLATFQRVKRLSTDLEEIRNAVRDSSLIKLSKSGDKVKRVNPYDYPLTEEQRERRTIYICYLPKHSTTESVGGIFGICGNINRIDIPADKRTGEIKGIAFVEFQSRKQARKAIAYFSDRNNDFFKLGMRVRQYTSNKYSTSPVQSPEIVQPHTPPDTSGSVYDLNPSFNYSKQPDKRKKRGNTLSGTRPDAEGILSPPSAGAKEGVREGVGRGIYVRNRSGSEGAGGGGGHHHPSGIFPIRQPKGTDGGKGFTAGRGKDIPKPT